MDHNPYSPPDVSLEGAPRAVSPPSPRSDISQTELAAFAGGERYPRHMLRMLNGESRHAGFNPWAALFGIQWYFFRKLYLFGLFSVALEILVPYACFMTLRMAFGRANQNLVIILGAVFFVVTRIFIGYMANIALCLEAVTVIKKIDSLNKDNETHLRLIAATGGVSVLSMLFIYVVVGICNVYFL